MLWFIFESPGHLEHIRRPALTLLLYTINATEVFQTENRKNYRKKNNSKSTVNQNRKI